MKVRPYEAALKATGQWTAKSNELNGRTRLELEQLSEGDLSIRGSTVLDIKKLIAGGEPRLSGELTFTGPLDRSDEWQVSFVPGDARVQGLLRPLLNRGIGMVRVPFWGRKVAVNIGPATEAMMTLIEAASKEIEEALEILAVPLPETTKAPAEPPAEVPAGLAPASPEPEKPSTVAPEAGRPDSAAQVPLPPAAGAPLQ